MFRFNYSPEFLQWALKPPNWKKDWHCGLRVEKTNKLVGFISGVPASVRIKEKVVRMVEINFLCVIKVLRSKRMAPVLIREITRRVHLHGIFQAVYTAGVYLPKPVGTSRFGEFQLVKTHNFVCLPLSSLHQLLASIVESKETNRH